MQLIKCHKSTKGRIMTYSPNTYGINRVVLNSGIAVDPLNVIEDDININDIAHALSLQCRYNGNIDSFYSVGYHAILMAWKVWTDTLDPVKALQALHHDDEEMIIGDMTTTLKTIFPAFTALGDVIRGTIFNKFNLPTDISWLKEYDVRICRDEITALMKNTTNELWNFPQGLGIEIGSPAFDEVELMFVRLHNLFVTARNDAESPEIPNESLDQQLYPETNESILTTGPSETISAYTNYTNEKYQRMADEFFAENPDANSVYFVTYENGTESDMDLVKTSSKEEQPELLPQPTHSQMIGVMEFHAVMEERRVYTLKSGGSLVIHKPRWVSVKRRLTGDSHRIIDINGTAHYIPSGWLTFSSDPSEGYQSFKGSTNWAEEPLTPDVEVRPSIAAPSGAPLEATEGWGKSTTGAQRESTGRANYDLVPYAEITEAFVRVAEYGAIKYAPWNWSLGMPRSSIIRSLLNHTFAYQRGQDIDEDKLNPDGTVKSKGSGLNHVDHILWNAAALAHNVAHGLEDGRRAEPPRDYL